MEAKDKEKIVAASCRPFSLVPKPTLSVHTLDWKILTAEEHARRRNPAYKYLIP